MRYINIQGQVIPRHCIYGPRPAEGIIVSDYEWWMITDHLDKEQREKELAAALKAKEQAKIEHSLSMSKNWTNTLANIKSQGNKKRLENTEKEKQDRIDRYNAIIKQREEESAKFCERMKKLVREEKDAMKTVKSAVYLSLVLEERRKQIECKNLRKFEEVNRDKEFALKLKKDTEDFRREIEQGKAKDAKKKAEQKEFLDRQVEDKKRRQKEADDAEEAKQDIINMRLEEERMKNCELLEKRQKMKMAAKMLTKTEQELDLERKLALEKDVEDEINQIYLKYERILKKGRLLKEQELKDEQVQRRIATAKHLGEKILKAAAKVTTPSSNVEDPLRKIKESRDAEKTDNILSYFLEESKKLEERRARQKHEKKEETKWSVIQRCRNMEVNEEFARGRRERVREAQMETKKALDCQIKQKAEIEENEVKEWQTAESPTKEELKQYFQEATDFAKELHLNDTPIRIVIEKIKKLHNIHDTNKELEQKQTEDGAKVCGQQKSRTMGNGCYCFKH